MGKDSDHITIKELRTPRAAAIAGILFAILFSTSYFLILRHAPGNSGNLENWLEMNSKSLSMGIHAVNPSFRHSPKTNPGR